VTGGKVSYLQSMGNRREDDSGLQLNWEEGEN
jgi:hypothetical protein